MSAPSLLHESRVGVLTGLADLAGYTIEIDLYVGLRPDVCRLHHNRQSILIADAKATERAEDAATRNRLFNYISAIHEWDTAGFAAAVAVCHGADPEHRWMSSITSLVGIAGWTVARSVLTVLDDDTAVSVVSFHRTSSRAARSESMVNAWPRRLAADRAPA